MESVVRLFLYTGFCIREHFKSPFMPMGLLYCVLQLIVLSLVYVPPAKSEISVLLIPTYSQVSMGIGSSSYAPSWNFYGSAPDFITSFTLPANFTACESFGVVSPRKINGKTSCNPYADRASSSAVYYMRVYGDVVSASKVRVEINADFGITWSGINVENSAGFNFYATAGDNVGKQVSRNGNPSFADTLRDSGSWKAAVTPSASDSYKSGDKTYYLLGTVEVSGKGGIYEGSTSTEYDSKVNAVTAKYIGKMLSKVSDTDNQYGRVGESLAKSLSVKVLDEETQEVAVGTAITFACADGKFSNNNKTIVVYTDASGVASADFVLGSSTGNYKITASCPDSVCTSGAKLVELAAVARSKELVCSGGICELYGKTGKMFDNPFRVMAIDKLSGTPASGEKVTYSVISFIDSAMQTHSGANGAIIAPVYPQTDNFGYSRAYFTPGPSEGTYIIKAHCDSCLEGQEQIFRAGARTYVSSEMDGVTSADPGANAEGCISGCCPLTPVVRQMVNPHNDGVSFTSSSDDDENLIALDARVLPTCLGEKATVTWKVEDAPGDYMYSGTPEQPVDGVRSGFIVGSGVFPNSQTGRPLPLSYKITANINYNGSVTQSVAKVQQDEIDKCRQEYLDFGISLGEVGRDRFTIGLDKEFVGEAFDCYAHIYPTRANEVKNLQKVYSIRINSGYRSPRANMFVAKSKATKTSWHMFGKAVDIEILPETSENYQKLWGSVAIPKLLESSKGYLLKKDSSGSLVIGNETLDSNSNSIPDVFEKTVPSGWLHMGE